MLRDNAFGEYIKLKRLQKNLTLRQAAYEIGIAHSHLSRLEKGVDPRSGARVNAKPELLKAISDVYKVDYYFLLSLMGYITNPNNIEVTEDENDDFEYLINNILYDITKRKSMTLSGKPLGEGELEYLREAIKVLIEESKDRLEKS